MHCVMILHIVTINNIIQLGTHRRGKKKREEMQKLIQSMRKAQQAS